MNNDIKADEHDQDFVGLTQTAAQSVEMLKAVVSGETYEGVAARLGKSRTAVERRIKSIAIQLSKVVGIQGLNDDGAAYVRRLRLHRDAILIALESFHPRAHDGPRETRILTSAEMVQAVQRIKGRSSRPWHVRAD